jgi:hypothetical protein
MYHIRKDYNLIRFFHQMMCRISVRKKTYSNFERNICELDFCYNSDHLPAICIIVLELPCHKLSGSRLLSLLRHIDYSF